MKSCLRNVFLFILIVGGGGILLLGYLGLFPSVSRILGSDKPRDLGIKYTQTNLEEGKRKTGVEIKILPIGGILGVTIQYLGQHKVDKQFDSEEVTAIANNSPWKFYPFSGLQIKFNKDGNVELTGILLTDRIISYITATGGSRFNIAGVMEKIKLPKGNIPFYIEANGGVNNDKVNLNIQKVELGRLPIPQSLYTSSKGYVDNFAEERMRFVKGLSVKSVKIENGQLNFIGTLPDFEALEK